ncbi:MAG TPA: hypothetical protein VFD59_14165 [Nocardioidaceae bacterium]|nr:hypothetical protein [Nocardioidaceae bacterium]
MTLLLNNDEVAQVLTMAQTLPALEQSYVDLANGDGVCRPRIDIRIPTGEEDRVYQWGTMEGGSAKSGYFAIRTKSDVIYEQEYGGTRTQEKYCVRPGLFCGLVFLFRVRDGELLAIMNDGYLQHVRVGADSGIGVKYAAAPDASRIGMLGSGGMARTHLESITLVRDIRSLKVYSPTRANREAYAAEMAERYGIEAVAVEDPREVYRDVDILCGCTDAAGEVIRGEWLEPGTHITCVGGRPDRTTYERVDTWLRLGTAPAPRGHEDWRTTEENLVYAACPDAEVWSRHASDRRTRRPPTEDNRARLVHLDELLSSGAVARTTPEEITYSERGNIQGAQFHAVAGVIYEAAVGESLGRELPTEWFLQDIRD